MKEMSNYQTIEIEILIGIVRGFFLGEEIKRNLYGGKPIGSINRTAKRDGEYQWTLSSAWKSY